MRWFLRIINIGNINIGQQNEHSHYTNSCMLSVITVCDNVARFAWVDEWTSGTSHLPFSMVESWKGGVGMEGQRWLFSLDRSGGSKKRKHLSSFLSNAYHWFSWYPEPLTITGVWTYFLTLSHLTLPFGTGANCFFLHASIILWQDSMIELWKEAVGRLSWKWPFSYDGSGGSFKREHPFWHLFFYQMPLTSPLLASSALSLLTVLTSTFLTPSFQFTQLLAQGPIHFLHLLIRNKNVWASCVLVHSFACSLICFKDI